ncbi:MAG: calcium-binding protein [Phycisphaerae bacterium]|nr:calcium-binding protein [Phycisphaerae bacterium]
MSMLKRWRRGFLPARPVIWWGFFALGSGMLAGCIPIADHPCTDDAECQDGSFCNGEESCADGMCVAAEDLCAEGEFCNEAEDRCDECQEDADCDDGDLCTNDVCADGACEHPPVECAAGQMCDPADGSCVDCLADADCDDGAYCNGVEFCADGACQAGIAPCSENQTCDEDGDVCVAPECAADEDCDDSDLCTGDGCADGVCVHLANNCDDGVACTDDSCDGETGECVHADNCPEGQGCDVEVGACVEAECRTDADCDDGIFCNGAETCAEFSCVAEEDPCSPPLTCYEDSCVIVDPPFGLTLGADTITGTSHDDTISAPLLFNAPTGTSLPSLQTGDSIDLGEGSDTLNAAFNFTASTVVSPTLVSIELFNLTDLGVATTTLAGDDITGLTDVHVLNSINTNPLRLTNLAAIVDLGLTNQAVGATLSNVAAATVGAADDMTLTLQQVTGGTVTIVSADANGIETLNVVSNGTSNTLTEFVQDAGTSLATVNISGAGHLTVSNAWPSTVTSVNASTATGRMNYSLADSSGADIVGGSGNDTLLGSPGADNINGRGGSDTINGGSGSDQLAGGGGSDAFRFDNSVAVGASSDVVMDWADGDDLAAISAGNTFGAPGVVGLAQGGGAAGSLVATAVGEVVVAEVGQGGATAVGTTQFIKLTAAVANAGTDQATFDAAIGSATVTGLTAGTSMAGSFYDTTAGQCVVFEALSTNGTGTIIEAGDVIRVIAKIGMSQSDYTSFTAADIVIY